MTARGPRFYVGPWFRLSPEKRKTCAQHRNIFVRKSMGRFLLASSWCFRDLTRQWRASIKLSFSLEAGDNIFPKLEWLPKNVFWTFTTTVARCHGIKCAHIALYLSADLDVILLPPLPFSHLWMPPSAKKASTFSSRVIINLKIIYSLSIRCFSDHTDPKS